MKTHLVYVLISLNEVNAELVEGGSGGVSEVVGDARLHGLNIGRRGAHGARSGRQRRRDLLELLLGHQSSVEGRVVAPAGRPLLR